ncbi:MAG: PD-(D/E)XK nuclease family protein [Cyclobacteriaceae bacterium]|nr:PD-(D/E)XK nuclease family protein [Cyclobacteriaceae bacterium]
MSIEEFIVAHSSLKKSEKLDLVCELYQVFRKILKSEESFDSFYYWGTVLLADFDELDKFLVDPEELFKNLAHVKAIEADISYLQEDQRKLIMDFWRSFEPLQSSEQKGFLALWTNLPKIYSGFCSALLSKGLAYDGLIYKQVVGGLTKKSIPPIAPKTIFAGFNVLSVCEEKIMAWYVENAAGEVVWDIDDYYFSDPRQEAGRFLRELKGTNSILRNTFRKEYPNRFNDQQRSISVINVATDTGQAQQLPGILQSLGSAFDENTAVVLPSNELLIPTLYALPDSVEKLNITMGYPLALSPVFGLLQSLIDLAESGKGKTVSYYKHVLNVLRHPLIYSYLTASDQVFIRDMLNDNQLWVSSEKLQLSNKELEGVLFRNMNYGLYSYLLDILAFLGSREQETVQKEFIYHFYRLLQQFQQFAESRKLMLSATAFSKLFRLIVQQERLPFEGEPLDGLQILGILETRNLDFDNVIVLSASEENLPPSPRNTSFVPYSIRKAYGLPVAEHQNSMYAYIFYRLLQRAKNVFLVFNSSEADGKAGEASRYIRQLERESGMQFTFVNIAPEVTLYDPSPIIVKKNTAIIQKLMQYASTDDHQNKLTPSALNMYLDCKLKFYFRYIKGLKEQEEVVEEVDPMVFGNIFHKVMENLYRRHDADGRRLITEEAISNLISLVPSELDKAFANQFGAVGQGYTYEGQFLLAREIVEKMALKVLEFDKKQAPFEILGIEANENKGMSWTIPVMCGGTEIKIGIKGIIDRIEQKDGCIRIVDYKTGKDALDFEGISSLFDTSKTSRRKAVFQTIFYGWIYYKAFLSGNNSPLQARLFNIRELFNEGFSPMIRLKEGRNQQIVMDIRVLFDDFEEQLRTLLEEIFDVSDSFTQTEDKKRCEICPYNGICSR